MWTGYGREDLAVFPEYPMFVLVEHSEPTDAAEIFEMRFGHRPHAFGKPKWNKSRDDDLMALVGGLIECSHDWSDCQDSFELIYSYFIDKDRYIADMDNLNAFFKRDDVMLLSEMDVHKW